MNCGRCNSYVLEAAKFCPECGSPIRESFVGPVPAGNHSPGDQERIYQEEKAQKERKSAGVRWILLAAICISVMWLMWTTLSEKGKPAPDPTGNESSGTTSSTYLKVKADVRFTGTQFEIQNSDSFDWANVKLEINRPGVFSEGYVLKVERIEAGATYTAGAMQFANSDGERFNPFTHKLQNFTLSCDTPRGVGIYHGESK